MTWFRKDPDFEWFSPFEMDRMTGFAESKMPRV
jgi:hypothetical protein